MKTTVALSIAVLTALTTVNAADDLSSMFSEGKASGQIRAFHINRDDNTKVGKQIGTAIGGHLKFETADYAGLKFGAAFYTTNRILRGYEEDIIGPNTTLFAADGTSYDILGEAYVQYSRGNTMVKIGRQRLDTPLAGADDARMLPSLFEAALLVNKDVEDLTLIAAHVSRFAPGSFANAYAGGLIAGVSGYSLVPTNNALYQGQFTNMGTWAIGEETDGVTVGSATYTGVDNLKVQVWDYYAHDILNAVYAQADLSWKCLVSDNVKPYAAFQYINESEVGDKLGGDIDANYYGVKAGAKYGGFNAYVAYSETTDSGSVISPWGGMPAFTQGMVTRHQFISDTATTKYAASYNFKEMGINLNALAYYSIFDMGDDADALAGVKTEESGFDIQYYPESVKNLQLRMRGNFPRDFYDGRDWDEYRFIVNYNF